MPRSSSRAAIVFLATALLAFLAGYERARLSPAPRQGLLTATPAPEPRPAALSLPLVAGTEIPATLAGGEAHEYSLSLREGQFVDLVVEQQGIDVILKLYQPGGDLETLVDSPNDASGPEPLPVLGETAGEYRLSIAAGNPADPSGRYTLRLLAVREAGAADRTRVTAERMFATGEGRRRTGTAESLAEATDWDRQALAKLHLLGDRNREAEMLFGLGDVHRLRDDWKQALERYESALSQFRQTGRTAWEARTRNNMGLVLLAERKTTAALAAFKDAERLHRIHGDPGLSITLSNLGQAYEQLGDIDRATDNLQFAYEELLRNGNLAGAAVSLQKLARLLQKHGQTDRATDVAEEAERLLSGTSNERDYSRALLTLATAYFYSGRVEHSKDLARRALKIQERLGASIDLAVTNNDFALLLNELGELREAERHYNEAVEIFSQIGDEARLAPVLANLGRLQIELQLPKEAERNLRAALAKALQTNEPKTEIISLYGLALLHLQKGEPEAASSNLERSLARIEELRKGISSPDLRASSFAWEHPQFELYIEALMQLDATSPGAGHAARAFETAERSRARGLLDDLIASPASLRQMASPSLLEEESLVSRQIGSTASSRQLLLFEAESDEKLAAVARSLRVRLAAMDDIEARVRRETLGARDSLDVAPLSLAEIQTTVMDEGTILLEFGLGARRSFLWAVAQDSFQTFELPPRAELEGLATRLHRAISGGDQPVARGQAQELLHQLSEALLQPVATLSSYKRVVIIPDGDLASVPFAALPTPGLPQRQGARGPERSASFGADHEVLVAPSASALHLLRRRGAKRAPPPSPLLAVGDAVFEATISSASVAAGKREPGSASTPLPLRRLPFARRELASIAALFGHRAGAPLLGFEASKEGVLAQRLADFQVIHFATHGLYDPEFPLLSAIVLSTVEANGAARDGFLRAYELRRLALRADLVVVSACQSARGKKLRGEGVVGLASSLLSAGAQQVLVSLWEVDDEATATLMEEFYRATVRDGLSAASALRRAQEAIASRPFWKSPYYWAGFVLIGDWRAGSVSN